MGPTANCPLIVTNESDDKAAPVYRLVMTNAERTAHLGAERKSDSMINATFISSFNGIKKLDILLVYGTEVAAVVIIRSPTASTFAVNFLGKTGQLNLNPSTTTNNLRDRQFPIT